MVLREETISYNLPDELAEVVQAKIREIEKQGLTSMQVKYVNQNTTIDAKEKKPRPGATNWLISSMIINHKNRKYQLGSFLGDPSDKIPQRHSFNPWSGILSIPLTDLATITLIVLHPNTKGSMFNKNKPSLYEIVNPQRELAISQYEVEVKKYVEFFIDKKLRNAEFQTVARRMGVADLSDIVNAKRQIKLKYDSNLQREELLSSLEANSDKFLPFKNALEKVYASEYMLSTDKKTEEQSWFDDNGSIVAKVEERDYTAFLSLVDYEEKLISESKKSAEPVKETETKPLIETSKSTTNKK